MTHPGLTFRHLNIGDVFLNSNEFLHRKVGPTTAVRLVENDAETGNGPELTLVPLGEEREIVLEVPVRKISTKTKICTAAA
jgi:hypothetical protein